VEQQRLQIVLAYQMGEVSMTELCKQYDISRKTAYKWYQRYFEKGEKGLIDRSRAPHEPKHLYTKWQLDRALDLKLRHRTWGPKKILAILRDLYPYEEWPCPTRLYEIFKDHHLVTTRRLRGRVAATAPLEEVLGCNDTWAVDFKGWFLM
jgi:hypothetical protein